MEKEKIDYIILESCDGQLELHRGRGGYAWKGQKGKKLEWILPIKVENNADEILKINGFVTNPVEQSKNVTLNLTYTSNAENRFFYVGMAHRKSDGTFIKTIVQSTNNQFIVPSVGENISTQVSLTVPSNTVPNANLPNGEYYDVSLQLWSMGESTIWGTRLGPPESAKLSVEAKGTLNIEKINSNQQFVIYPNPVCNVLNIENVETIQIKSIKIATILGETVLFENSSKQIKTVDVSQLNSGTYIISISSILGTKHLKFIKI